MKYFSNISGEELAETIKVGWNLGNTLEATGTDNLDSETSWGLPLTTRNMIDGLVSSGIKSIRLPVSWHNHIINSDYTIDEFWMRRVKTIVNWAIEDGMYVILNVHHDTTPDVQSANEGKGYYPLPEAKESSEKFLTSVWKQICEAFNDEYDEHLIFEVMNEPRMIGHKNEWWYDPSVEDCVTAQETLNGYTQLCLDTIRKSGGNNSKRFVMIPALAASSVPALSREFKLPDDTVQGKLLLSVHLYNPTDFAQNPDGKTVFDDTSEVDNILSDLNQKFSLNGVPVIIGEIGAIDKDNLEERQKWYSYCFTLLHRYGMAGFFWDNEKLTRETGTKDDSYAMYNRRFHDWYFPTLLKASLDAMK